MTSQTLSPPPIRIGVVKSGPLKRAGMKPIPSWTTGLLLRFFQGDFQFQQMDLSQMERHGGAGNPCRLLLRGFHERLKGLDGFFDGLEAVRLFAPGTGEQGLRDLT